MWPFKTEVVVETAFYTVFNKQAGSFTNPKHI